MPSLNESPTLKDLQRYVAELEEERGFSGDTVLHKCLLLGEEVGELFKAVRKHEKIKTDSHSDTKVVNEELADILIYVCSIANRYGVDLEAAFRGKEEVNKNRQWK
jgi:NTP pyrophosphatase (non-canonical NTP hydrolase)